jgi:hypothetical protein
MLDYMEKISFNRFTQFKPFNRVAPFKTFYKRTLTSLPTRDERWTEAIAVGGLAFIEQVKAS